MFKEIKPAKSGSEISKNILESLNTFESVKVMDLQFNFLYYFRIYFNSLYTIGLCPFWVSFFSHNQSIALKRNLLQNIICAVVHLFIIAFSVLRLKNEFKTRVRDKPEIIFVLASSVSWAGYICIIIGVFWLQTSSIQLILEIPRKPSNFKATTIGIAIVSIIPLIVALGYCSFLIFDDDKELLNVMDDYSEDVFNVFGITKNNSVTFSQINWQEKILVCGWILTELYYNYILSVFEGFILLSALSIYEIVSSTVCLLKGEGRNEFRVQERLQYFVNLKKIIGKINKVNGLLVVAYFVQIVAYISETLTEVLDEEHWGTRAYIFSLSSMYVFSLVLAAEASHKAYNLEKWIVRQHLAKHYRNPPEKFGVLYVETVMYSAPGHTGMIAKRLFLITYGFLGEAVTVLITYSMIMIQFKETPSHGTNCTTSAKT